MLHGRTYVFLLGFRRREPYYQIPTSFLPITVFMQLDLSGWLPNNSLKLTRRAGA
jgi:hypothetical protein